MSRTIAEIQIAGVLANKGTKEILDEVLGAHPGARTSKACVAWYRSHVRNDRGRRYADARGGFRFDEAAKRWEPTLAPADESALTDDATVPAEQVPPAGGGPRRGARQG
jgi:hypothetical protein